MTVPLKMAYVDLPMLMMTILIGRLEWERLQVERLDPRPITRHFALVSFYSTGH